MVVELLATQILILVNNCFLIACRGEEPSDVVILDDEDDNDLYKNGVIQER